MVVSSVSPSACVSDIDRRVIQLKGVPADAYRQRMMDLGDLDLLAILDLVDALWLVRVGATSVARPPELVPVRAATPPRSDALRLVAVDPAPQADH